MLSVSRRVWVFFAVFSAAAWLGGPGCIPLDQPEEADPFGPDQDNASEDQGDADEAAGGNSAAGASIFGAEGTRCADCHGEEEAVDGSAPDLTGLDATAIEAGVGALYYVYGVTIVGRIYRILPKAGLPGWPQHLDRNDPAALVDALGHPNGWHRTTAQRLLVDRVPVRVEQADGDRLDPVEVQVPEFERCIHGAIGEDAL